MSTSQVHSLNTIVEMPIKPLQKIAEYTVYGSYRDFGMLARTCKTFHSSVTSIVESEWRKSYRSVKELFVAPLYGQTIEVLTSHSSWSVEDVQTFFLGAGRVPELLACLPKKVKELKNTWLVQSGSEEIDASSVDLFKAKLSNMNPSQYIEGFSKAVASNDLISVLFYLDTAILQTHTPEIHGKLYDQIAVAMDKGYVDIATALDCSKLDFPMPKWRKIKEDIFIQTLKKRDTSALLYLASTFLFLKPTDLSFGHLNSQIKEAFEKAAESNNEQFINALMDPNITMYIDQKLLEELFETPAGALASLTLTLRESPEDVGVRLARAALLLRLDRKDEAKEDCEFVLCLDPANENAQLLLEACE